LDYALAVIEFLPLLILEESNNQRIRGYLTMSKQSKDMSFRETTLLEKLLNSSINIAFAFILLLPFFFLGLSAFYMKLVFVGLFFLENLLAIVFNDYRLPGMLIQDTRWKRQYPQARQFMHAVLYTLSFSTLLFWMWFPGDLLLFNLLVLQVPCVLLTKTTLHGLLSGNMVDVKLRTGKGTNGREDNTNGCY